MNGCETGPISGSITSDWGDENGLKLYSTNRIGVFMDTRIGNGNDGLVIFYNRLFAYTLNRHVIPISQSNRFKSFCVVQVTAK